MDNRLDSLGEMLTDVVFDPSAMQSFLSAFADVCDVPFSEFRTMDRQMSLLSSATWGPWGNDTGRLESIYRKKNPRLKSLHKYKPYRAVRDQDVIPLEDIQRDGTYQDFIVRVGVGYYCAVALENSPDAFTTLVVHRPLEAGAFTDAEAKRVEDAVRACQGAYALSQRVQKVKARSALESVSPDIYAAVLTADAKVLEHNENFEALLKAGIVKLRPDKTLTFQDPKSDKRLRRDLGMRPAKFSQFVHRPALRENDGWLCNVLPRPRVGVELTRNASHILIIEEISRSIKLNETLTIDVFGLTKGEADIAAKLFKGMSAAEIAESRGVTYETVRGMIKSILSKTGCSRQSQLVAKLSGMKSKT